MSHVVRNRCLDGEWEVSAEELSFKWSDFRVSFPDRQRLEERCKALTAPQWGLYATTTENTSSCYLYYFALIRNRSTSTIWPNYPVTELVGTVFK